MALTYKEMKALKEDYDGWARVNPVLPCDPNDVDFSRAKSTVLPPGVDLRKDINSAIDWKRFADLPVKDFPEDATKPLQSLTKTYITMMENETEKDDWSKALDILYPEKGE